MVLAETQVVEDDILCNAKDGISAQSLGDFSDVSFPRQTYGGRQDHHTDKQLTHQYCREEVSAQNEGLDRRVRSRVGKPRKKESRRGAGSDYADKGRAHFLRPHPRGAEDMDSNLVE